MNRRNNAEETKEKIIAVSTRLFIEKGFEKTSIQDISEALGMSKGAIYHHFNSKKDIIDTVRENKANNVEETVEQWLNTIDAQSAKEKLTLLLEKDLADQEVHSLDNVFSTQIKSPDFIVSIMRDSVNASSPVFAKIMKEGNMDGSITTKYPNELAEVFFLLFNIWCDPAIFECDEDQLNRRLQFLHLMMKKMGADIMNEEILRNSEKLLQELYAGDE
ncbi:TetR family transcriptional regulator [Gracilibacillus salitolerans]|uniref:TetR family transcriptional regulator n=1 Tax=Gracilibacillus salitolerans TaxID=2663022 RepID=A0A5Q2THI8_9BACI|nr:TetR/AcrR family transcriptional regulator [Gracilibacillus salitolerans]QGH32868.1 TetR family transcriptional regulator [Gracilibacillus salitolerans]